MATVKFVPYQGGQIHAERTNDYISNGHGDEVLIRTNRYVTGEHSCGNRCEGVNCPSDPALASELMESLRVQYEHNLGDRNTKGTNADKTPVAHYQLVVSWHTDESVSPAERYEMGRELIERTKLKYHANLMAAHDNTDEDHLHISASAFSLDGHSKLCMNNKLLYDLRREMDKICVAHGYSIVEAPELWGDEEFKEWFDCVKDLDIVTVHPPLPKESKKKKTQKEQYAAAKKEEREAREQLQAELLQNRKRTPDNQGTHFYSLPHVYNPNKPDEQLYIFALDEEGKRRSPLELDFALHYIWAKLCGERLSAMPDFPSKRSLETRINWAYNNAWDGYALMQRLDIGTRAELDMHTKAVGGDISRCKQEIARQGKVIATALENGDTAKQERAEARKAHAEKLLAERSKEYRELKRAAAVLDSMDTGEHWQEFKTELMQRSTKRLRVYVRTENMIRTNFRDIGQLLGVSQTEIDRMIAEAKASSMDEVEATWYAMVGSMKITYTKRKSGLSAMYEHVGDLYAQRREMRSKYHQIMRDMPILGPITLLLYMAMGIAVTLAEIREEEKLEQQITYTRRIAEEIRWHNQNAEEQLDKAKRALAFQLLLGDAAAGDRAWMEFAEECEKIMERTRELAAIEAALAGNKMQRSSVRNLERQIKKTMELRKPSLDEQIRNADSRAGTISEDKEKEGHLL